MAEGTDSDEEDDFDWAAGESSRSDWGEKYPASVGLYHVEPSEHDISKFYVGMVGCGEWRPCSKELRMTRVEPSRGSGSSTIIRD